MEDAKQAGRRPFGVPALLGVLLCATSFRLGGILKSFVSLAALSVAIFAGADPVAAQKPYPAGIIDLPPSIDAQNPIGTLTDHPWLSPIVDGVRIRTGWNNTAPGDGVYNWTQIDECLANALASGKPIGLGISAGITAPPWLMGGETFTDGISVLGVPTLTSATANFRSDDIGRVIVSDAFTPGTTIVSINSSTSVQTSLAAIKNANPTRGGRPFSILTRQPGGAAFRVLADGQGVQVVPWDPFFLNKFETFIAALGARYDGNLYLRYVPMGGLGNTGESRVTVDQADFDFFDASAVAAGYSATGDLSAAAVAWEAAAKEITNAYMAAFPTTPCFITSADPFGDLGGGEEALEDFIAWGVATYPGRFGIMNAQLNAIAQPDFTAFAPIYNNRFTQPTGVQFLCSSANADNVARLSHSPPYGPQPLLSPFDAVNNSLIAAITIGCRFVETYEVDVENPVYEAMLALQGAALKGPTPTPTPPSITTHPTDQTVTEGDVAQFTVTATGTTPLTYQWMKNGVNISGATSQFYTTPATTMADNGAIFAVVVTNAAGSVTSNNATLTVNPAPIPPSITTQPTNQTVSEGQTARFTVEATGTAPLRYQWQKNGVDIPLATNPAYITPPTMMADNGAIFSVVIGNDGGTVTSSNATLTVNPAIPPSITTQPTNQTVTEGQAARFTVDATGTEPLTYQWKKNGVNISGATNGSYTTPPTTMADSGAIFAVVVTNVAGSVISNNATLTVNPAPIPPSITTQPTDQTVSEGQTARFTVTATGTAPLRYQWKKNGVDISLATNPTYTTPPTTMVDNGAVFSVMVANDGGSVTSNNARLTVNAAIPPSITTQPTNQTVTEGQAARFTVTATGTTPLTYQWKKNGVNIPGATNAAYTTPPTTQADNGAIFAVVVSNIAGSVTSNNATLTVNPAPIPPSITTQPADATVTVGATARFTVTATGTAPLRYQWKKNGVNIPLATNPTYNTPPTTMADNGALFSVVVSNAGGSVTSRNATLTVNAAIPPSITTQPTNQTVREGRSARFTVTATGTAPLTYQWKKNGVNIPGATNAAYTTPPTTQADNGALFSVVVSNIAGSVTSNNAILTVQF